MNKLYKIATLITATIPLSVLAQTNGGLNEFGDMTNLGVDLNVIESVASLINAFLGFVGVVFILIIIFSGFKWMVSGGDEEKVAAAKKALGSGVIGLIIIVSAYSIAQFVVGNLVNETGGNI